MRKQKFEMFLKSGIRPFVDSFKNNSNEKKVEDKKSIADYLKDRADKFRKGLNTRAQRMGIQERTYTYEDEPETDKRSDKNMNNFDYDKDKKLDKEFDYKYDANNSKIFDKTYDKEDFQEDRIKDKTENQKENFEKNKKL
jgi:hypothetical protein